MQRRLSRSRERVLNNWQRVGALNIRGLWCILGSSETQTKRRCGAQVQANEKSVQQNNRLRIRLSKQIQGGVHKAPQKEGLTKPSHTSVEMNSDEASKQRTRPHTAHQRSASVTMVLNRGFNYDPVLTNCLFSMYVRQAHSGAASQQRTRILVVGAREDISRLNSASTHHTIDGRRHRCSEVRVSASFSGGWAGRELECWNCRCSRNHTSRWVTLCI